MVDQDDTHALTVGLRLTFTASAVPVIERHVSMPAEAGHELTVWYDTEDGGLAARGMVLGVRRQGGDRVQLLRVPAGSGPVFRRAEWVWPLNGEAPAPALLTGTPAEAVSGIDRLVPVLETELRVLARRLALAGGAVVQAVLATGRAGDAPVHALELRLEEGPLVPLFDLAAGLNAAVTVRLDPREPGLHGRAPGVVAAAVPFLPRQVAAGTGFRALVQARLGDLVANQPAAAARDAEGVHQMRVAIRRLRALLVLFGPMLPEVPTRRFEDELKRLGQVLGAARDWDVFCLETAPAMGAGALLGAAEQARAEAYAALDAEFARPLLTALVLAMAAWAEGGAGLDGDLKASAPGLFDRVERVAHKRGRHIARRSEEELHALRKALKRLRYGVESLAGLHAEKPVRRYLKRCRALQELLGQVNDGAVALALAEQLGAGRPELAEEVVALRRAGAKRGRKAVRAVPQAWERFRAVGAFWK